MEEPNALTENVVRYGTAALICFTIAVVAYIIVVAVHMSNDAVQRIAALGVAWWLVGCALVPLAGYWMWRRSVSDRADE